MHLGKCLQLCACIPKAWYPSQASSVMFLWEGCAAIGLHTYSQGPHSCLWAWIWPCTLYWLVPQESPIASPSCCASAGRTSIHSRACRQPGSPEMPVGWQLALAIAIGSSFHHCMCVGNQPLPLHRCLELAPVYECMHTTSSSHHDCLPCFLATKDPNSPVATVDPLSTNQGPHSCPCCGPQQPGMKNGQASPD